MASEDPLDQSVQYLKGVGPARAADFARLEVRTVGDLLFTFPRALSDRTAATTIADAPVGETTTLRGRIVDAREKRIPRKHLHLTLATVADATGTLDVVWFNAPWLLEKYEGQELMLFGKTKWAQGRLKMEHPQVELVGDEAGAPLGMGRIVPLYPCTGKLTQNVWRRVMRTALETHLPDLPEILPEDLLRARGLPDRRAAVRAMHFPESDEERDAAHARLVFEECLLMQLAILLLRRHQREDLPGRRFRIGSDVDVRIRRLFPFRLTRAQDRAVAEIAADMVEPVPMHRLLQGDVGCGKTVIALYAMLAAVANKAQVCLMAPTALLARQHEATLEGFLAASKRGRVRVGLLLGNLKAASRRLLLAELEGGAIDILVATHSALQADVVFRDLGLVVIDEQHKFGVHQRTDLVSKGVRPDTLVMTATPIPRSLGLTLYGDLDVSVIDELPPGRKAIKTSVPPKEKEPDVWAFLRREVAKGRQAFVVSPLVEEGASDITSATEAHETLGAGPLRGLRLGLVHGRMKRDDQEAVMATFREGRIDVLVSTVVIEVGVDIPNATVMVVLHAERFGLAQLHQLRGRIGRGAEAGHFILLSENPGEVARRRLEILAETSDGFVIAEEDLRLRGPGEILGKRQHGLPEMKLVDIVRDLRTIREAREEAKHLLDADPGLARPPNARLRRALARFLEGRADAGVG